MTETTNKPDLSSGPHPLQNQWVVWEHVKVQNKGYNAGLSQLLDFKSVESFWRFFNNYPKPSEIFFDGATEKLLTREGETEGRRIEGLSIFKKGIAPAWEDAANKNGADYTLRSINDTKLLDTYWENLCLGIIGETIDEGDEICGIRVVDKSKRRCDFRIEIWLRSQDRNVGDLIHGKAKTVLSDGQPSGSNINLGWKAHKSY